MPPVPAISISSNFFFSARVTSSGHLPSLFTQRKGLLEILELDGKGERARRPLDVESLFLDLHGNHLGIVELRLFLQEPVHLLALQLHLLAQHARRRVRFFGRLRLLIAPCVCLLDERLQLLTLLLTLVCRALRLLLCLARRRKQVLQRVYLARGCFNTRELSAASDEGLLLASVRISMHAVLAMADMMLTASCSAHARAALPDAAAARRTGIIQGECMSFHKLLAHVLVGVAHDDVVVPAGPLLNGQRLIGRARALVVVLV